MSASPSSSNASHSSGGLASGSKGGLPAPVAPLDFSKPGKHHLMNSEDEGKQAASPGVIPPSAVNPWLIQNPAPSSPIANNPFQDFEAAKPVEVSDERNVFPLHNFPGPKYLT